MVKRDSARFEFKMNFGGIFHIVTQPQPPLDGVKALIDTAKQSVWSLTANFMQSIELRKNMEVRDLSLACNDSGISKEYPGWPNEHILPTTI